MTTELRPSNVQNMKVDKSGGTIVCYDSGMACHVVTKLASVARRSANHDDTLAELTTKFNQLIEPYLQEREDGKCLRMISTEAGEQLFAWVICEGVDFKESDVIRKYGPIERGPDVLRKALGL